MSAEGIMLDAVIAQRALMGSKEIVGVFEQVLGFRPSTNVIKPVHIMNDLGQCVFGGVPSLRGDLLCRVIRHAQPLPEDNSDEAMRADPLLGEVYRRAYPEELGQATITQLREGARVLFNADNGVYRAGDNMASGLATHWALLGAEGFRRFGVGAYIASLLDERGRSQLKALLEQERDPVTLALAPLRAGDPINEIVWTPRRMDTPLDLALGEGLRTLLDQPLSKPARLRALALAGCLGVCLKIFGAGSPGGRPTLLATPLDDVEARRALRDPAVQALSRSIDSMDRCLADTLAASPEWQTLTLSAVTEQGARVAIPVPTAAPSAPLALVKAMRAHKKGQTAGIKEQDIYWPDQFAITLGKKIGAVGPRHDQAGWGKHLTLTADLVEVLVLMFAPAGEPPQSWRGLWAKIRDQLGVLIGANEYQDSYALEEAGVPTTDLEALGANNDVFLEMACRRGIARRLPDSGAEVSGVLS
jgi:hypothetical protein